MNDKVELRHLMSTVVQLRDLIDILLKYFTKFGLLGHFISPIELIRNRFGEFLDKLFWMKKSMLKEPYPSRFIGNRLEALFDKLVTECHQIQEREISIELYYKKIISVELYKEILLELQNDLNHLLTTVDNLKLEVDLSPDIQEIIEELKSLSQQIEKLKQ